MKDTELLVDPSKVNDIAKKGSRPGEHSELKIGASAPASFLEIEAGASSLSLGHLLLYEANDTKTEA